MSQFSFLIRQRRSFSAHTETFLESEYRVVGTEFFRYRELFRIVTESVDILRLPSDCLSGCPSVV